MNTSPAPKLWSFIYPIITFVIGYKLGLSDHWYPMMYIFFGVGIVMIFLVAWSEIWNVFARKAEALQYLFDSAKGLDKDRVNDLLVAMGLKPAPIQHINITITKLDQHGVPEQTLMIYDLPCSIEELHKLADGLINEHAPFSRREWVDRRNVFKDTQYRKLQDRCEKEKLIIPKESENGFDLTPDGRVYFTKFRTVPSPTPQREEVLNP